MNYGASAPVCKIHKPYCLFIQQPDRRLSTEYRITLYAEWTAYNAKMPPRLNLMAFFDAAFLFKRRGLSNESIDYLRQ